MVDALCLVALVGGLTALYSMYALRVGSFQPDEGYYMEIARFIAHDFPSGLWQAGIYSRGIQRVDQLILAAPFALTRGAAVYEVAHVIQVFLFVSSAIPVWLLARGSGLGRWARALAASLAVVVPWAIVSTSFLAESAAYPAYAWVLYATWRVTQAPSVGREAVALIALALAALSRTALLALAPILPLAVLWQEWSWELRGRPWQRRFRELPGSLWSRHRLLSGITVVAAAALLLTVTELLPGGGVGALTGYYGLPEPPGVIYMLAVDGYYLSRIAVGTGVVAFAFGLAWVIRELSRARDGRMHALAAVSVLGVAMVLLSLLRGGPDERYILYAAAPVALAYAAELDVRVRYPRGINRMGVLSMVVAAAGVIALIATAEWPAPQTSYDFFTYPAAVFFQRVILGRLSLVQIPLLHPTASQLVLAGVALIALVWIAAVWTGRAVRPAAVLLAAAVLALCAMQLAYSLQKFTGSAAGTADGTDPALRSWLESELPAGTKVAAAGIGLGETAAYTPVWRTAEFWNTAIDEGVSFVPNGVPTLPFGGLSLLLTVHGPGGRISASWIAAPEHAEAVPRYVLVPRQATNPVGFAGQVVSEAPYVPLNLVKLTVPARVEWTVVGTSLEGFMTPGKPAVATVFANPAQTGRRCATLSLLAPPGFAGRWRYAVSSNGRTAASGSIAAQQVRNLKVRLRPSKRSVDRLATVTVHVYGQVPYPNGKVVSAQILNFNVSGCAAAG